MKEFTFHGQEIPHRVGRYVVAITWVRDGAYFVEVRHALALGVGPREYEKSYQDETSARQDARALVEICRAIDSFKTGG